MTPSPLRPRPGRLDAGTRTRLRDLARNGQEVPRAHAAPGLDRPAHRLLDPLARGKHFADRGSPGLRSPRSSNPAATTGSCAGPAPSTRNAATSSSPPSPGTPPACASTDSPSASTLCCTYPPAPRRIGSSTRPATAGPGSTAWRRGSMRTRPQSRSLSSASATPADGQSRPESPLSPTCSAANDHDHPIPIAATAQPTPRSGPTPSITAPGHRLSCKGSGRRGVRAGVHRRRASFAAGDPAASRPLAGAGEGPGRLGRVRHRRRGQRPHPRQQRTP